MIRQLPFVIGFAAFRTALQACGSEQQVTPIMRFGNPDDRARISVENAHLSWINGATVTAVMQPRGSISQLPTGES
jgi:hypothetical protein